MIIPNDGNVNVTYAAPASVTTYGLSSVNNFTSVPDLSDDELIALQLKDKNKNGHFAPGLKLPKGKVYKNNFEECVK